MAALSPALVLAQQNRSLPTAAAHQRAIFGATRLQWFGGTLLEIIYGPLFLVLPSSPAGSVLCAVVRSACDCCRFSLSGSQPAGARALHTVVVDRQVSGTADMACALFPPRTQGNIPEYSVLHEQLSPID